MEVHHIGQQKDANKDGFLESGIHKNHKSNLIVLCSKCHDDYHANKFIISPAKQTSEGVERNIQKVDTIQKKSKWNNEQLETIHCYLKKFNNLGLKRIKFELEKDKDIIISESSLRTIIKEIN